MLIWDDTENKGEGFIEWKPASHPVYGNVETGGFITKFFSQNPPARHLEPWIRNEGLFNVEMIKYLPELEWGSIEAKKIKAYKADSADYQLKIGVRNTGKLPTALKQAYLVKIVRADRLELEFDTAAKAGGLPGYRVIEEKKPAPSRAGRGMFGDTDRTAVRTTFSKDIPFTEGGSVTETVFTIRLYNRQELKGKASVYSTRGGVLKNREFIVK